MYSIKVAFYVERPVLHAKLLELGVDISYVTAVMFISPLARCQGVVRGNRCITGRA
jgi:hypothetical protein